MSRLLQTLALFVGLSALGGGLWSAARAEIGSGRLDLAQAGSAGGSIGKSNKSASGAGDGRASVQSRPDQRSASRPARATSGSSNVCSKLAGTWTANGWWNALYGRGDVSLRADGSARHNSGIVGRWTCKGGGFVMDWKNWAHGEGSVSSDGNTITFADGSTMTRGR